MLDWVTCVSTFNKVVELESFAAASRALYTTPSAISKRIAWLEEELGVVLLNRSTRKLNLTEAGAALYSRGKPLLSEWGDMKREVASSSEEPHGLLRIGTPTSFGDQILAKFIASLLIKYPKLAIEVSNSNCGSGIHSELLDVYVTYEHLMRQRDDLVARPLQTVCKQLYASPGYLRRCGQPQTVSELAEHNCLTCTGDAGAHNWQVNGETVRVSGNFSSDNTNQLLKMALAGAGILCVSKNCVSDYLANGELVPIFPDAECTFVTLAAYYPKMKYTPKKVDTFLHELEQYLQGA